MDYHTPAAISSRTRIETESINGEWNKDTYAPAAISSRTRIETRTARGAQRYPRLRQLYPVEQGLKHLTSLTEFQLFILRQLYPVEQGLKPYIASGTGFDFTLRQLYPVEQGLKQAVMSACVTIFWLRQLYPVEQGLKHVMVPLWLLASGAPAAISSRTRIETRVLKRASQFKALLRQLYPVEQGLKPSFRNPSWSACSSSGSYIQ